MCINSLFSYVTVHVYGCEFFCTFRHFVLFMIVDIAMLVLEKCTEERNDRDDVSFEMTFDYEFKISMWIDQQNIRPHPLMPLM